MSGGGISMDITLQICFGVFRVMGRLIALAGLQRDSLACMLYQCFRRPRVQRKFHSHAWKSNAGKNGLRARDWV